jgi:class 3 adenylate cyclase
MSLLFAATYPERTLALILFGAAPRFVWAPDYPWAPTREEAERRVADLERRWGTEDFFDELFAQWAPSMVGHDIHDAARRNFARVLRSGASPGAAAALNRMNLEIDVRPILPAIRVPTLVIHRSELEHPPMEAARLMADQIPGARLLELPGADQTPFAADLDVTFEQIERFLTESWEHAESEEDEPDRILATVLFTDIVGSTEKAVELGDRAWRELVLRHHDAIRRQLARFRGQEVDTAGDGFFASFDGPARAIRCATAITDAVRELGVEVRAGVHTGECEVIDGKVGGIAVHIGARVASQAEAGEVLVSGTVRDLVAGSGIDFADRGVAELKGIPGEWRLYAVDTT